MANNRMYLVHVSSGKMVRLGKRMGWGWYGCEGATGQAIHKLFDEIEEQFCDRETLTFPGQDDFALVMEDNELAPHARDFEWLDKVRGK